MTQIYYCTVLAHHFCYYHLECTAAATTLQRWTGEAAPETASVMRLPVFVASFLSERFGVRAVAHQVWNCSGTTVVPFYDEVCSCSVTGQAGKTAPYHCCPRCEKCSASYPAIMFRDVWGYGGA